MPIWRTISLIFMLLVVSLSPAAQPQRVLVAVHLDADGKVVGAAAEKGDPVLFKRAIEIAKGLQYQRNCDSKGNPSPSTIKIWILFDENGHFTKAELPIVVGEIHVEHRIIKKVDPEYPDKLKRAGIKDVVILEVHVDKQGTVTKAEVFRGDPQLAGYAVKAVLQWKYLPVYLRCESVPMVTTVTLNFPR
jgi:TonB family protein